MAIILCRGKWWILERGTGQSQKSPVTFCLTAVRAKLHLRRMLENRPITANKNTPTAGSSMLSAEAHSWSAMPISPGHKGESLTVSRDKVILDCRIVFLELTIVTSGPKRERIVNEVRVGICCLQGLLAGSSLID